MNHNDQHARETFGEAFMQAKKQKVAKELPPVVEVAPAATSGHSCEAASARLLPCGRHRVLSLADRDAPAREPSFPNPPLFARAHQRASTTSPTARKARRRIKASSAITSARRSSSHPQMSKRTASEKLMDRVSRASVKKPSETLRLLKRVATAARKARDEKVLMTCLMVLAGAYYEAGDTENCRLTQAAVRPLERRNMPGIWARLLAQKIDDARASELVRQAVDAAASFQAGSRVARLRSVEQRVAKLGEESLAMLAVRLLLVGEYSRTGDEPRIHEAVASISALSDLLESRGLLRKPIGKQVGALFSDAG